MSVRSGKKTSRNRVATYKGFEIIKVTTEHYHRNIWGDGYDSKWIEKRETHFDFCKEGDDTKPSKAYECWASDIAKCKECIDRFIEDDTTYFTKEEREKYVLRPNAKCDWGFHYDSLMKLMREHQKADKRMKVLLEDRLEDANFSTEYDFLHNEDYEGFEEYVTNEYTFDEKFEVYLKAKRKPIKDVERLTLHIKSAIEDYFKAHCMDVGETSVVVRFCEE